RCRSGLISALAAACGQPCLYAQEQKSADIRYRFRTWYFGFHYFFVIHYLSFVSHFIRTIRSFSPIALPPELSATECRLERTWQEKEFARRAVLPQLHPFRPVAAQRQSAELPGRRNRAGHQSR